MCQTQQIRIFCNDVRCIRKRGGIRGAGSVVPKVRLVLINNSQKSLRVMLLLNDWTSKPFGVMPAVAEIAIFCDDHELG